MSPDTAKSLASIQRTLKETTLCSHAARLIEYDRMTVCPPKGRAESGDMVAALSSNTFRLLHEPAFVEDVKTLHAHREELTEWDQVLSDQLYRSYRHTCGLSPEINADHEAVRSRAWQDWFEAKEADDYGRFRDSLQEIIRIERERAEAFAPASPEEEPFTLYERMLDDYERGMTEEKMDQLFGESKERIVALLKRLQLSGKQIRSDFLTREVTDAQQQELTDYLLDLIRFDRTRGSYGLTEHPFTDLLGRDDVRITTNYDPHSFISNFYSVLHEGGHALFEQMQPAENHAHFIEDGKTMGMHESVSRFYENVIGRSRAFISLVYPKLCEIFPQVFFDVTQQELYEAVNLATPSLIRMDADELTYTLHIIIRYELEKQMVAGTLTAEEVPEAWNRAYEEILGVRPDSDRQGVLQDSHWSSGFGYFPTYALGNFYNAMYTAAMEQEFDLEGAIARGDFEKINGWMAEHVFKKADRLTPAEWIRDITGRELVAEDFLKYLEEKYSDIYELQHVQAANKDFDDYVRRMTRIRMLSSPHLAVISTADAYHQVLAENFRSISVLADENRELIRDTITPLLESREELSEDLIDEIRSLNEKLMDVWTHNNIDLPIMALLSDRLLQDAEDKGDDDYLIRQLDEELIACIALVVQTRRVISHPEIAEAVRKRGLEALEEMMSYLDHDKFERLSPECRELVMINARYADGLFVTMETLPEETRKTRLAVLERAFRISKDPWYIEHLPDYDWDYHYYRLYQYISSYDEFDNAAGNSFEELQMIADYGIKLEEMWMKNRERFEAIDNYEYIHSHTMRNLMHAGRITREKYAEEILNLYNNRRADKYDVDAITSNIELPREYISALDPASLTEEEKGRIESMYRAAVSYVFRIPKVGVFYELMDYYAPLIFHFVEVPGGISFEEMGLQSFAAFHPPTYIHSMMVAQISRCLASHLMRRKPELFVGVCGCPSKEEVAAYATRIEHYVYHAALCHDFGKLIIIDTIFNYGRNILNSEFDIIREHPDLGAMLLERHDSTRAYSDIARGHHLWYNGQGGYPTHFDAAKSPVHSIIAIVACADCMDAATDSVGRSYNRAKSLDTYIGEVEEGCGTRYAPYLAELLQDREVKQDLTYLLTEGRHTAYRRTWLLLKEVHDRVENPHFQL